MIVVVEASAQPAPDRSNCGRGPFSVGYCVHRWYDDLPGPLQQIIERMVVDVIVRVKMVLDG